VHATYSIRRAAIEMKNWLARYAGGAASATRARRRERARRTGLAGPAPHRPSHLASNPSGEASSQRPIRVHAAP